MTLKELLSVFPSDMLVNITQPSVTEPVCSTAFLLDVMLNDRALNAAVLRVQATNENHIPVLDVQINDCFPQAEANPSW